MLMKKISALLLGAALLGSSAVYAGNHTYTSPSASFAIGSANSYVVENGAFTDTFNFIVDAAGLNNFSATVSNLVNVNPQGALKINLFNDIGTSLASAQGSGGSSLNLSYASLMAPGAYQLEVRGTGTGGINVAHGYNLSTTVSPAPEPETYSMMLLGLGLVGGIARSRKNKKVVSANS
ncbi:MAG: FxDxF family PEP-CTERM protein [Pseudomonadota bacterium]